eukprot:TRINITY_DN12041_c0_g1_i1.p1 TRINITY_DN12041_c0_g1~~TRINITY_DN12041_c0_g1_i1.p1  ORF type:complete len:764 (+),score=136.33 TRINITY_DN12041_c0_g1_i1:823-3114(+)
MNGQPAVLLSFDRDAGCWLTRLASGDVKALRPEHVLAVTPAAPMARAQPPSASQGIGASAAHKELPQPASPARGCGGAWPRPSASEASMDAFGASPRSRCVPGSPALATPVQASEDHHLDWLQDVPVAEGAAHWFEVASREVSDSGGGAASRRGVAAAHGATATLSSSATSMNSLPRSASASARVQRSRSGSRSAASSIGATKRSKAEVVGAGRSPSNCVQRRSRSLLPPQQSEALDDEEGGFEADAVVCEAPVPSLARTRPMPENGSRGDIAIVVHEKATPERRPPTSRSKTASAAAAASAAAKAPPSVQRLPSRLGPAATEAAAAAVAASALGETAATARAQDGGGVAAKANAAELGHRPEHVHAFRGFLTADTQDCEPAVDAPAVSARATRGEGILRAAALSDGLQSWRASEAKLYEDMFTPKRHEWSDGDGSGSGTQAPRGSSVAPEGTASECTSSAYPSARSSTEVELQVNPGNASTWAIGTAPTPSSARAASTASSLPRHGSVATLSASTPASYVAALPVARSAAPVAPAPASASSPPAPASPPAAKGTAAAGPRRTPAAVLGSAAAGASTSAATSATPLHGGSLRKLQTCGCGSGVAPSPMPAPPRHAAAAQNLLGSAPPGCATSAWTAAATAATAVAVPAAAVAPAAEARPCDGHSRGTNLRSVAAAPPQCTGLNTRIVAPNPPASLRLYSGQGGSPTASRGVAPHPPYPQATLVLPVSGRTSGPAPAPAIGVSACGCASFTVPCGTYCGARPIA